MNPPPPLLPVGVVATTTPEGGAVEATAPLSQQKQERTQDLKVRRDGSRSAGGRQNNHPNVQPRVVVQRCPAKQPREHSALKLSRAFILARDPVPGESSKRRDGYSLGTRTAASGGGSGRMRRRRTNGCRRIRILGSTGGGAGGGTAKELPHDLLTSGSTDRGLGPSHGLGAESSTPDHSSLCVAGLVASGPPVLKPDGERRQANFRIFTERSILLVG